MVHKSVTLQLRTTVCDSIAHRIALAGCTSEKAAESAIKRGEVEVDGQTVKENVQVHAEANISYKGKTVPMNIPTRLWGVKKPRNNGITLRDVMNLQSENHEKLEGKFPLFLPPHVNIVKSLDARCEGLVLMTNDSMFARRLRDADSKIQTVYKMKLFGAMPSDFLRSIRNGVMVNGIDYGPVWVEILKRSFRTSWIRLRLVETPERCLDSLLDYFRLRIMKSERDAFGPIRLGNLAEGCYVTPLQIPPCFRKFIPVSREQFCMLPTHEDLAEVGEMSCVFDALKRHSAVKTLGKSSN